MWAAITSHAHIWGFHGNVHIAWGVYYIGIIILHLIPCTLQNIDESVPVCLELKLCQSHALVRLSSGEINIRFTGQLTIQGAMRREKQLIIGRHVSSDVLALNEYITGSGRDLQSILQTHRTLS